MIFFIQCVLVFTTIQIIRWRHPPRRWCKVLERKFPSVSPTTRSQSLLFAANYTIRIVLKIEQFPNENLIILSNYLTEMLPI